MSEREFAGPAHDRAWTWQHGHEPLDLKLVERPLPPLLPDDVLVRNEVAGLNPVDWKALGGRFAPVAPGAVPGVDGAGIVVAAGAAVPSGWVGQRVAYHQSLHRDGSFAEHTVVAHRALLRVPDAINLADAAAFPCPALTAVQALDKLPAQRGRALLVGGAGGSVGHWVVQLAAARGWQVTTMSNPRHWDRLKMLGAARCVEGPLADGQDLPSSAGRFFAAIDLVGAAHAVRLAPALSANGHLVCVQDRVEAWPCPPFGRALSIHEVALGALHGHGDDGDWQDMVAAGQTLLAGLAAGELRFEQRVESPFDALPTALDALRHRTFTGKPLLRVGSSS